MVKRRTRRKEKWETECRDQKREDSSSSWCEEREKVTASLPKIVERE